MSNDLTAWNNTRFQVSFDVSAWGTAYALASSTWQMQVRASAASTGTVLDIPETHGSAVYASGVVVFSAPLSAISRVQPGSYEWDFGFVPPSGDFVRIDGGHLTIEEGVTR